MDDPVEEAHGELSPARVALADDLRHAANHVAGALARCSRSSFPRGWIRRAGPR